MDDSDVPDEAITSFLIDNFRTCPYEDCIIGAIKDPANSDKGCAHFAQRPPRVYTFVVHKPPYRFAVPR